jgi:hypothetical protein
LQQQNAQSLGADIFLPELEMSALGMDVYLPHLLNHYCPSGPSESERNFNGKTGFFPDVKGLSRSSPLRRDRTREVSMSTKDSLLANVIALALIGILAGALAGLGVGMLTGRSASSTSTTSQ